MKFKKLSMPSISFKSLFKKGFNVFTATVAASLIVLGSLGMFVSYINPVPTIAGYLPITTPNIGFGTFTLTPTMLEPMYATIQSWQTGEYPIAFTIATLSVMLGLALHIKSVHKVWAGIKASPRAIYHAPMNFYRKLRTGRDWLLAKIEYLNSESAKWKRTFQIMRSPYSFLRMMGFSPQMAIGLIAVGGTAGTGVVVNETILAERSFQNGDAGIYAAPHNTPDPTLEATMAWRQENKNDNTLRVVLGSTPVREIKIENVSVGTVFTGSALPTGKTEVMLIEGTDVSGGTATRLEVGELIFEKNRCKTLEFDDIKAHTINVIGNASDGQSINTSPGTARMRGIGGGHHQAEAMVTSGGLYDRIWIDAPTSGVNGKIGKLHLSNIYTKGGSCILRQMDIGTLTIQLNETGNGDGFATKDFEIKAGVTSSNWNVEDNVEVSISEPATSTP
tara:strand:- start:826 stop:2169 length:1344 start_codon:yes stop_codon:yes gene_type:complete